jgi:UDP-N-acetylglucosamine:LPS N-acetylglucosamine transferase
LESAGGLIQVSQAQIDQIPVVIDQLIVDRATREAMGVAMAALGRPAAAQMIARALQEVADG